MVKLKTVLVLGAGASWDFSFPTGGELVTQILDQLGNSENKEFKLFIEACQGEDDRKAWGFHDALQKAKPLSIDAWLEHNPAYIGIGKVAIAIALLQCEQRAHLRSQAKGDWYQLLFDRLNTPFEDFQKNEVSIVSFNYDRSFEQRLFETSRYTHSERGEKECKEELNQLSIVHVYGCLGRLDWQVENPETPLKQLKYGAALRSGWVITAAENIKIMPETSMKLPEGFQEARRLIADAKALYFLGFGYDKTSMERLGIEACRTPSKVMGTAYGLGYQRRREIERLAIRDLSKGNRGLVPKSVYEFLHDYIDFNEGGLPDVVWE
jgi:hypothetical protein